jgi:hypothetical protein
MHSGAGQGPQPGIYKFGPDPLAAPGNDCSTTV